MAVEQTKTSPDIDLMGQGFPQRRRLWAVAYLKKEFSMENKSAVLLCRLTPYCAQALEAAATRCQTRAHAEISIEHWLLKLLELGEGDITVIARPYKWDMDALWQSLLADLDALPRSVHSRPQLSQDLLSLMKAGRLALSLQDDNQSIRSLKPLLNVLSEGRPELQQQESLSRTTSALSENPLTQKEESGVTGQSLSEALQAALDKFTLDVTAKAKTTNSDLHELLRPILRDHFQPALLARFQTLVYRPLDASALRTIVEMKLAQVAKRLNKHYGLSCTIEESLYDTLVAACLLPDTGARNIDSLLNQQILPVLSQQLLSRMSQKQRTTSLTLGWDEEEGITLAFKGEEQ